MKSADRQSGSIFFHVHPPTCSLVGHMAVTFRGKSARVQTEKKCQARAVCPGAFAFNTSNSRKCFYLEQCDANESHCHMYAHSHFCCIKVLQLWPRDRKQSVPEIKCFPHPRSKAAGRVSISIEWFVRLLHKKRNAAQITH